MQQSQWNLHFAMPKMRWLGSLLLGMWLGGMVWGQSPARPVEVWLEVVPVGDYPIVSIPYYSLFFQVGPRLSVGIEGNGGFIGLTYEGLPLPQVDVSKERYVWVKGRYTLGEGKCCVTLRGEGGIRYHHQARHVNRYVRGGVDPIYVENTREGWVYTTWGLIGDFSLHPKVNIGGYVRGIVPTFYGRKGERFYADVTKTWEYAPIREWGVFPDRSWIEVGMLVQMRLGNMFSDPLNSRSVEKGVREVSLWAGPYVQFFRHHSVYDAPKGARFPRLYPKHYYDQRLLEEALGGYLGAYPRGDAWGIWVRGRRFGVGYGHWAREWSYWRELDENDSLPIGWYDGEARRHELSGGYRIWGWGRGDVVVRGGGVLREGHVYRMVDTAFTNTLRFVEDMAFLREVGVSGGVRLEFRPVWFGYVYADGGVSHMLWGQMVDYHRTTWTLGVGAGVRIPLGEGKAGKGL